MDLEENMVVKATFSPPTERANDLEPGMSEWVGYTGQWKALWRLDASEGGIPERLDGQWAMMPLGYTEDGKVPMDGHWVPQEDLRLEDSGPEWRSSGPGWGSPGPEWKS